MKRLSNIACAAKIFDLLPVKLDCAVKCLSIIACVACRCGELFILYCLCGLPVRWNVCPILPVGLACAANCPCIRSAVKNPASLAKPGQAALSGFLAKLTGTMRPGKAWQAWPRPSFLGNLGHKSSAFSAMLVPRPDFLGNLGQKKKQKKNNSAFLATKMLARLSWIFCH